MGLGRVIADSIISLSPPPSGSQITWALGHCPLDSAQRQREMAKQFISFETECRLGLTKCLGPESNDRALILEALMSLLESTRELSLGPNQGVSPLNHPTLSGTTWSHIPTPTPQLYSGGCQPPQLQSQAAVTGPRDRHVCQQSQRESTLGAVAPGAGRRHPFHVGRGWKNTSLELLETTFLLHEAHPQRKYSV